MLTFILTPYNFDLKNILNTYQIKGENQQLSSNKMNICQILFEQIEILVRVNQND